MRHGWPVKLPNGATLLPAETATGSQTTAGRMLISGARAVTLKLLNQRHAAAPDSPVLMHGAEPFDLAEALAIADPSLDLAQPLKGPFKAEPLDWKPEAVAAMELARIAGILPAFLVDPEPAGEAVPFASPDLAAWSAPDALRIVSRARLPIAASESAEIVAFRKPDDMREHVALIVGKQRSDVVPMVRVHSECLTGDVFGSLKCDCGPQLDGALAQMAEDANEGGWGVVLYMRQEGRGIGLINKLRAYRLQDQGFDTVDANERLGLPDEARDFETAARMLDLLGIGKVRLLTNNPAKVDALTRAGVAVAERIAHRHGEGAHNRHYLATKRDRSGHLL